MGVFTKTEVHFRKTEIDLRVVTDDQVQAIFLGAKSKDIEKILEQTKKALLASESRPPVKPGIPIVGFETMRDGNKVPQGSQLLTGPSNVCYLRNGVLICWEEDE